MRCCYRERIFEYDDIQVIEIYPVFGKARTRRAKYKPTSDVQKNLNSKNSIKHLERLLLLNFANGLFVTLTYDDPHNPGDDDASIEIAKKDAKKILRKLRAIAKKKGEEFKFVIRTERGRKKHRLHHHLAVQDIFTIREIKEAWENKGWVSIDTIVPNRETGLIGLANYMCKHEQVTYKAYSTSRNLIQPEYKERTGKISQKKVRDFAQDSENRELFEKQYDSYEFVNCAPLYNAFNCLYYLTVRLQKRRD